jgi:hypothetical protein
LRLLVVGHNGRPAGGLCSTAKAAGGKEVNTLPDAAVETGPQMGTLHLGRPRMTEECGPEACECLHEEIALFEMKRADLVAEHEDEFVLLKGSEIIGFYPTQQEAYVEGLKRFGNKPFLIKQVKSDDPPECLPAVFLGLLRANT